MNFLLISGIILLLVLSGLLVMIMFGKIRVNINVNFQPNDKRMYLNLYFVDKFKFVTAIYDFVSEELFIKIFAFKIPVSIKEKQVKKEPEKKKDKKIIKNIVKFFRKVQDKKKLLQLRKKIESINMEGKVNFGTGNPYTTGMIMGGYNTFLYIIPQLKDLEIVPDFLDTKLEGKIKLKFQLYLFKLLKGWLNLDAQKT